MWVLMGTGWPFSPLCVLRKLLKKIKEIVIGKAYGMPFEVQQ